MADLVTLAEYKAYQGITSTTDDAKIRSLITRCSELVKSYCGRTFLDYYNDAIVEEFGGNLDSFLLSETPINQVTSVEYSIDYGKTFTTLVEYTDYVVDKRYGKIVSVSTNGFPKYLNGYKVTYTGGYAACPEDLKLAVLDLVVYYMKSDMSIKSTRGVGSNQTSIEYITTANMPSHIRRVLDLYREYLI